MQGFRWLGLVGGMIWSLSALAPPVDVAGPPFTYPALQSPEDVARDYENAQALVARAAPEGFLAVFGGARVKPGDPSYELTRRFAYLWTKERLLPVATGGGPGQMEAANRGAKEAGGTSLGFVLGTLPGEPISAYLTHHHVFGSFTYRQAELIDNARVLVFTRGGIGTAWEMLEALTKIESGRHPAQAILCLGPRAEWEPTLALLRSLAGRPGAGAVQRVQIAETAEDGVRLAKEQLARTPAQRSRRSPETIARDVAGLREYQRTKAPRGFALLFGTLFAKPGQEGYESARRIARELASRGVTVATGGGSGISEAGNRGAREGGGRGLAFAVRGFTGAPNVFADEAYVAGSLSKRESEMIHHAGAIVVIDGCVSSQWAIFEALTKVSTRQMPPRPIVLFGPRERWQPLLALLDDMGARGVADPAVASWLTLTDDVAQVVDLVAGKLAPGCPARVAGEAGPGAGTPPGAARRAVGP